VAALKRVALLLLVAAVGGCTPERAPDRVLGWFLTPDQQGRLWFERGDPVRAARSFEDPLWKGLAFYAAEEWEPASAALVTLDTARGHFQRGNALARLERLPEAAAAYERALELEPELAEARFNLDWVSGLLELDQKEYEDAGGTGGQLEADAIVFDERGAKGKGEMTEEEARAQGLSDAELRELWMRRVQTTPGDFLRRKFAHQLELGAVQ
jgi:Ca-activated chloride channel family protein